MVCGCGCGGGGGGGGGGRGNFEKEGRWGTGEKRNRLLNGE